jgi:threonine synthase
MKTNFSGFRCFRCATEQGADFGGYVCPACGGNLEVRCAFPQGAGGRWWVDEGRRDIFRYRALLPVTDLDAGVAAAGGA